MLCSFRFVEHSDPGALTFRLFRHGGVPMAEITGPLLRGGTSEFATAVDRAITDLDFGFSLAIRIANTTDSELVVSGDSALWHPGWGDLVHAAAPAVIAAPAHPIHPRSGAAQEP